MANRSDKINAVPPKVRHTFGQLAKLLDTERALRSLAVDMGIEDATLNSPTAFADLPAALREAYNALTGERDGLQADKAELTSMLDTAVSAHESANGRLALLLDEPCCRSETVAPGGVMQGYRTADGRNIMLLAVHPDGANPGYSDDVYIDIILHLDRPALLDSVELTAANVGWGDGRLDICLDPDDIECWLYEEFTPARTDRDAPPACRTTFNSGDFCQDGEPLRLDAGDHILRIHYYSRNEQTPERTIGIGAATFNLSNYLL